MSISTETDRFPATRTAREAPAGGAYALLRIKADFLLKSIGLLREFANGDLQKNLVYLAIWLENVRDIPDALLRLEDALDRADFSLNPVTVRVVSDRLGVPYETVRRHANGLVQEGLCQRVTGRGIVIVRDRLKQLAQTQSLKAEQALLQGLASALNSADVKSESERHLDAAAAAANY